MEQNTNKNLSYANQEVTTTPEITDLTEGETTISRIKKEILELICNIDDYDVLELIHKLLVFECRE